MENEINNNDSNELSSESSDEGSRLQELISNIPWAKILLGIFVLFLVIWAVIYFFNRGKNTSTVTPSAQVTSIATNAVDQNIAIKAADNAASKLGVGDYNKILQPYFSLDSSNQFSANDTRVALLQALNTLEATLDFDLLAHLATQPNREQALNQYEQKLRSTVEQMKQYVATLQTQAGQLVITLRAADAQVATTLENLNTVLKNGAPEGPLTESYHSYMTALKDRSIMQLEQSTLNSLLAQVAPLQTQADKRLANITSNHKALVQDIQIIDANDPGLKLIQKAN